MLMLITVLVLSFLLESPLGPQQTTAMTAVGATILIANHVIMRTSGDYFDAAADTNPLLHVWSLSVEEQFYLGFPALVILACMIGRRSGGTNIRASALSVAVLTGASFSFSLVCSYADGPLGMVGDPAAWAFYSAPSRAWEFGVGALVALWAHSRASTGVTSGKTGSRKAVIVALAAVLLLLGGSLVLNEGTPWPGCCRTAPCRRDRRANRRRQPWVKSDVPGAVHATNSVGWRPVLQLVSVALAGDRVYVPALAQCHYKAAGRLGLNRARLA